MTSFLSRRTAATLTTLVLTSSIAAAATSTAPAVADPFRATSTGVAGAATPPLRLLPVADGHSWASTRGASVAATLGERVLRPAVPDANALVPRHDSDSTTVTFTNPPATSKATKATVWHYSRTGTSRLRLEVLVAGKVRARSTLAAHSRPGWRSMSVSLPAGAGAHDLELRLTAMGGSDMSVRAAYAVVGSAVLRPDGAAPAFTVRGASTAAGAVADRVTAPARPRLGAFLTAKTSVVPHITTVNLAAIPASAPGTEGRAWVYVGTGARSTLRIQVVVAADVVAETTVPAGSRTGWRSVPFTTPARGTGATVSLRLISRGPDPVTVHAAQAIVYPPSPTDLSVNRAVSAIRGLKAPDLGAGVEQSTGPASTTTSDPLPDPSAPSGASRYQCTTTPKSLETTPSDVVTLNPDAGTLWLGALLQGQGYSAVGSLRELPIRKRAPLTVFVDVLGRRLSQTVGRPDPASVQGAVADLVQRAVDTKVPFPAKYSFNQVTDSSTEQALLKLGLSVKWLGGSVKASLDTNRTVKTSSVAMKFAQNLFTVSIVQPQTPADYFSSDFTAADLEAQRQLGRIGAGNPPVVISSISYGRMMLYTATSEASQSDLTAALSAAYSSGAFNGEGNLTAQQKAILEHTTFNVATFGGDDAAARDLIKSHELGAYLATPMDPRTSVPISYTARNVGDASAARFAETTNYELRECQALPNNPIVIGKRVKVVLPQSYLDGPRDPAEAYGNVKVGGEFQWNRNRDATEKWVRANWNDLAWTPIGGRSDSEYDVYFGKASPVTIRGNINCRLNWWEIGSDPSNQYDWTWDPGQRFGSFSLDGGSQHCRIHLKPSVNYLRDIVRWEP